MKIQYIQNTCDIDGIKVDGEYLVLLKDGIPLSYLDLSNTVLEVIYIEDLLRPFEVDIEFEELSEISPAIKRRVNKFLKNAGCE